MKTLPAILLTALVFVAIAASYQVPYIPTAPGDAAKFLDGTYNWTTPAGSGGDTNATISYATNNAKSYADATFTSLFARTVLPAPTDAGVTLTFAATPVYSKLGATGNVTIAFGSLAVNRTYDLLIANSQATNITVTLPTVSATGFTPMGFIPSTIAAGKHGQYWFTVDCQTNTIVYGTFAEQP